MMGLTDSAYNLSWLITTFIQMTFVSILITLVTGSSVFEYSNKVYVFIYFEAFSLAVINMCFLLSTFFSRSKSASLLGPMIFFASFFPYYAGKKTALSIFRRFFRFPCCGFLSMFLLSVFILDILVSIFIYFLSSE